MRQIIQKKPSNTTYQALYIQYCRGWRNLSLRCNGTCWKFLLQSLLELLNMVFQIPIYCGYTHQAAWMSFPKPFNVNWPTFLVNSMIPLRVMLQHFFQLFKFKILQMSEQTLDLTNQIMYQVHPSIEHMLLFRNVQTSNNCTNLLKVKRTK